MLGGTNLNNKRSGARFAKLLSKFAPDSCSSLRRMISLYADGLTSPEQSSKVESHIASCVSCHAFLVTIEATHAVISSRPPADMPAGLGERLHQALANERRRQRLAEYERQQRIVRYRRAALVFGSAGAAAVAAVVLLIPHHQAVKPSQGIAFVTQNHRPTNPVTLQPSKSTVTFHSSPKANNGESIVAAAPQGSRHPLLGNVSHMLASNNAGSTNELPRPVSAIKPPIGRGAVGGIKPHKPSMPSTMMAKLPNTGTEPTERTNPNAGFVPVLPSHGGSAGDQAGLAGGAQPQPNQPIVVASVPNNDGGSAPQSGMRLASVLRTIADRSQTDELKTAASLAIATPRIVSYSDTQPIVRSPY